MSRIVLSKHDDGSSHLVVGWDRPMGGAFWQEYASADEIADAYESLETLDEDSREYYEQANKVETGVKRQGGELHGIALHRLVTSLPEELRHYLTPDVFALLVEHRRDPDYWGYINKDEIDMTEGK